MKIAFYSAKQYEIEAILPINHSEHEIHFITDTLSDNTAYLSENYDAICCFVTDCANATVIEKLAENGVKLIALRSAGFDHVDLAAAKKHNITVVNVPEYSPEAVAEFGVALLLALSRKLPQALKKSTLHDYSLDGLLGMNLHKKTVGIVGCGRIGTAFAKIMQGFGARVLVCDPTPAKSCLALPVEKVDLDYLLANSDVISLHTPLNTSTKHIINDESISKMKKGVIIINTGRGALIDTAALVRGLESKHIGAAGLDVYENEHGLFFENHSNEKIKDTLFLKLQSFSNVIITGHVAFFSQEAIDNIARTSIENINAFSNNNPINQLHI